MSEYLRVEMECIWCFETRRIKIIVTSEGEYFGHFVNFDRSVRIVGMKFRGTVYSTQIWSATRSHCILVNHYYSRDPRAYEIIYDPRGE